MSSNKYDYDKLPISDETKKGMSLNINDLGAIGRMLSLQDDVYDERFTVLTEKIDLLLLGISGLKEDVANLKKQLDEMAIVVECTKKDVGELAVEVDKLKKLNSFRAIIIRVVTTIAASLVAFRLIHGPL